MSKESALNFLSEATKDEQLKEKVQASETPEQMLELASEKGYNFSPEHVDEALTELQKHPGFFGSLAEAVLELFSPTHDDYPTIGVQPFSGDTHSHR